MRGTPEHGCQATATFANALGDPQQVSTFLPTVSSLFAKCTLTNQLYLTYFQKCYSAQNFCDNFTRSGKLWGLGFKPEVNAYLFFYYLFYPILKLFVNKKKYPKFLELICKWFVFIYTQLINKLHFSNVKPDERNCGSHSRGLDIRLVCPPDGSTFSIIVLKIIIFVNLSMCIEAPAFRLNVGLKHLRAK